MAKVSITVTVDTVTKVVSVAPGSGLDALGVALVLSQVIPQYISHGIQQSGGNLVMPVAGLKLV